MKGLDVFAGALNIASPWYVAEIELVKGQESEELHITIEHNRRTLFEYEGGKFSVHDHQNRTWKHLDFFQHTCYIHARVPRVKIGDGKVKLVEVPWAQKGSSFTVLFEYKVIEIVRNGMSVSKTGETLGISAKRAFSIITRKVAEALSTQPLEDVKQLSIDETSAKKGHNYLTVLCDRDRKKVVGISAGKDAEALAQGLIDMEIRGAQRERVKSVTMDMSTGYIAGVAQYLPQASIVFDYFHIMKQFNKAVDQIRRQDQKESRQAFIRTRYLWLRGKEKLTTAQQQRIAQLSASYPRIGKAYQLKERLRDIFAYAHIDSNLNG